MSTKPAASHVTIPNDPYWRSVFAYYTAAQLREMPETARFEDRAGRTWRPFFGITMHRGKQRFWTDGTDDTTNSQLARRVLRRVG